MQFVEGKISERDKRTLTSLTRGIFIALISLVVISTILPKPPQSVAGIVIPSLVTMTSLVATFLVLSFNLGDQLPHQIVEKYLLYNRLVWSYLGIQGTFIVIFSISTFSDVIFLNNTMPWALAVSTMITIGFFKKFLARTTKKGVFQKISDKIDVPEISPIEPIEDEEEDSRYDVKESYKAYVLESSRDTKSAKSFAKNPNIGVLKIDNSKLRDLLDSGLVRLTLYKHGYIFDGSEGIFGHAIDCKLDKDSSIVESDVMDIISVEGELEWLEDWATCVRHSAEYSPDRLSKDFDFLADEITELIPKNPSILTLVLNRISDFFSKDSIDSRQLMNTSIRFVHTTSSKISDKPEYIAEIQKSLVGIFSKFVVLTEDQYSPTYASAVSEISSQTNLGEFKKNFETEEFSPSEIVGYKRAMLSTVLESRKLVDTTIKNFSRRPEHFSRYLRYQTKAFVNLFSFYDLEISEDDLNQEKDKENILYLVRELHRNAIADIAFQILFFIDNGEVKVNMSDLAFQMMRETNVQKYPEKEPHIPEECYSYFNPVKDTLSLVWPDYFSVKSSSEVREIGNQHRFPKDKYLLLYVFYLKLNDERVENSELEKFEIASESIEGLSYSEFEKWFDYSEDKFREVQNELTQ